MGALSLQSLPYSLSTDGLQALKQGTSANVSAPRNASAEEVASPDVLALGKNGEGSSTADAVLYHAQMQRVSLAVRMQEIRSNIAAESSGAAETSDLQSEQLTFEFFGEIRSEELAVFQRRTDTVAEGLNGVRQATYIEVSRRVAARFEMSMSISGSALSGFNKASEVLQPGDGSSFDRFLGLVDGTLANSDDIVQTILDLLDGFFRGERGDFEATFTRLMEDLFGSGFMDGANGSDATAAETVSARYQFEFSFTFSASVEIEQAAVQQSDPIVLDLNGNGIELTSYKNGARFDIAGNGRQVTTAFVTGGDAFLAIDRNDNGAIDSGKELFGDQNGAVNGYEELARLDSNGDHRINKLDRDFDQLRLFRDNGDGKTDPGELISLAQAGIAELSLDYRAVALQASGGNRIAQIATYRRADGSSGRTADALLSYKV